MAVPLGGSQSTEFLAGNTDAPANYDVALSVSGLPPGTSAQFPATVSLGQTFTLTISAPGNAPESQNMVVTVTGTPIGPVAPASAQVIVSVSQPPGSLANNRTDYTWLRTTPYDAAYDPVHNLIFASDPEYNRVDVVSNVSHAITQSIPIPDPRGVSLSIDGNRLWVAAGSQQMFAIDTATLASTRYRLPGYQFSGALAPSSWEGNQILALADGTVLMGIFPSTMDFDYYGVIWDPVANSLTALNMPGGAVNEIRGNIVQRSADGKHVFFVAQTETGACYRYDVATKTTSAPVAFGSFPMIAAVNNDGGRIAIFDLQTGIALYDGNCNLLSLVPGGGMSERPAPDSYEFYGGFVFNGDGSKLYEISIPFGEPLLYTIDTASLNVDGVAPAIPFLPAGWQLAPMPFFMTEPFAVDNTGVVIGLQFQGIAFEDSRFYRNLDATGVSNYLQHMSPYFGSLAGGTQSGGFGSAFSYAPDVFYGNVRGSAAVDSSGILHITSPASPVAGPVNVKFISPDGTEDFNAKFFTYGVQLLDSVLSGAAPEGNSPGEVTGFGIPGDQTGTSVSVGGSAASITTKPSADQGFIGQLTATSLGFTIPPGQPGWTSVSITTPNGSDAIAKGVFYAKSVTEYPSSDQFQYILYDAKRQQIYLSAGNKVDVFSLASKSFVTPFTPVALTGNSDLRGLALTPDGSRLLVANLLDGSLAIIDPDNPTNDSVIAIAAPQPGINGPSCMVGPLFVSATSRNQAIVLTGGQKGTACTTGGQFYFADLASKALITSPLPSCFAGSGVFMQGTADGSKIAFTSPSSLGDFGIYDSVAGTCLPSAYFDQASALAVAGDGNAIGSAVTLLDGTGNVTGRTSRPETYYPSMLLQGYEGYSPMADGALQSTKLNDSGGLYYWANPRFIDIFDVVHGRILLRFSLPQTVSATTASMAIDESGRQIFLITSQGFTVVDLGTAPLAVGHLSTNSVSSGAQVQMRGSGFDSGTTVSVDGTNASVTLVDESTLNFIVPPVTNGAKDIVLRNLTGSTYILENALQVH